MLAVAPFKHGFPQFPQVAKRKKKEAKKKEMAATTIYLIPPLPPWGITIRGASPFSSSVAPDGGMKTSPDITSRVEAGTWL